MTHFSRQILLIALPVIPLASVWSASSSAAITQRVKMACRSEYYAYCSAHPVPSAGLRSCMRAVQSQLSPGCLKELVAAGEVSQDDMQRHKARSKQH